MSSFPLDKKPNASYTIGAISSQLEFDPRCYNIIYSGKDSILWLSKKWRKNFEDIYDFDAKVTLYFLAWSNRMLFMLPHGLAGGKKNYIGPIMVEKLE